MKILFNDLFGIFICIIIIIISILSPINIIGGQPPEHPSKLRYNFKKTQQKKYSPSLSSNFTKFLSPSQQNLLNQISLKHKQKYSSPNQNLEVYYIPELNKTEELIYNAFRAFMPCQDPNCWRQANLNILISPLSKFSYMEYDGYYQFIDNENIIRSIAYEYNGKQHYKPFLSDDEIKIDIITKYEINEDSENYQSIFNQEKRKILMNYYKNLLKDELKKRLSDYNGIDLIIIPYTVFGENDSYLNRQKRIHQYIYSRLLDRGYISEQSHLTYVPEITLKPEKINDIILINTDIKSINDVARHIYSTESPDLQKILEDSIQYIHINWI